MTGSHLTELCVHIPCGGIRGPVPPNRQSCVCEPDPQRWDGCDVSREKDLCIICFRGTAGGTSKWSWRACDNCRAVNAALGSPFALGRHSIMNGIGVQGGQSAGVTEEQIARLLAFARGDGRLADWRRTEYQRLAEVFDSDADVPLWVWQEQWPPSSEASLDAFRRLLGDNFPAGLN